MKFLLILHLCIGLCLIVIILLQKTSSDSTSGINSEFNNSNFISGESITNITQKVTFGLIAAFLITSIALANLSSNKNKRIYDKIVGNNNTQEIEIKK